MTALEIGVYFSAAVMIAVFIWMFIVAVTAAINHNDDDF